MPRVTYVKKAQQRYETVPVLDDDGKPKTTPKMRNGQQMTTKHGRLIFVRVTREDRSKPKPMPKCDAPDCRVAPLQDGDRTINVGAAYKSISPKSGPYGGQTRYRHGVCPTWQVWEYSSSLSARLARVDYEARQGLDETDRSSVQDTLQSAADGIREIAEEKRESAQNMEEGFGHETGQSAELADLADQLEEWADAIESAADGLPDDDRPEEEDPCPECDGTGHVLASGNPTEVDPCPACDGSGHADNSEAIDEWDSAVEEALAELDNCPV